MVQAITPATEWAWINGALQRAGEARVSIFDSGFMQGIGLFETLRAYNGRTHALDEHLTRMRASAAALGWTTAPDADQLVEGVDAVMGALGAKDARVRITVTTGSLHAAAADEPQLTQVVTASHGGEYDQALYEKGATVLISRFRQNPADPTTGHKTTSYFARLASLREAHAAGAIEALWFTTENALAEGAISNVLLVRDGELHTPPLETPVLPGVTRRHVLELARRLGLKTQERSLTIDDLLSADEVILTNSMMELLPVVRIEREPVADEKPGPVYHDLHEIYQAYVQEETTLTPDDLLEDEDEPLL